jgi:DNA-binding response OmpR family regulator
VALTGSCVAIFEDEALLAMWAEDVITAAGGAVTGIAGSVAEAEGLLLLVRPAAVVVDLNLRGDDAVPLLRRLHREGMPCVVTTGYPTDYLPADLRDVPLLPKPYAARELVEALSRAILNSPSNVAEIRLAARDGSRTGVPSGPETG